MKTKNKTILVILGSLLAGLLLGWVFFAVERESAEGHVHTTGEAGETVWTCSMHPQIRAEEPGKCPICGMDLIPLEETVEQEDRQAVHMSDHAMRLANVQTRRVGVSAENRELRLNGKVAVDERKVFAQSTHIPGRIEQLSVNFTGETVNRGQALATIYSPELVTAQEELLQAYAIRESNPELFQASRDKLRNWRIGEAQIERILEDGQASERFTITADVGGVVIEKMVELGDYVERGMPLYQIADLSTVWVLFDIYENAMSWINEGSTVEFTVASFPGETFEGTIEFIDPLVSSRTRVATARVEVENRDRRLKPEMFVTGIIQDPLQEGTDQLSVPRSSVLWTGRRSVVYVKEDSGFKLREVTLGPSLGDSYLIRGGLEPGEEIVVNGAFTVDAAAQLAGKPSMMNPELADQENQIKGGQEDVRAYLASNPYDFRDGASQAFQEQLEQLVRTYFNLKEALVEGDHAKSNDLSRQLLERIRSTDPQSLQGDARIFWEEKREFMIRHARLDLEAESLEERRENFIYLSEALIKTVAAFGLEGEVVYVDHCPMANSDKGAYWLSDEPNIRNPYYGEAMLTCGEVVEEIK